MNEEGRVREGWHVEGLGGWKEGMGKLATVWGGEIVGMRGVMQMAPEDRKILVLSDSQVAIAAIRKAGKTSRARAGELKEVVEEVRRRQKNLGPDAVIIAWVKAQGNEKADQMAKSGAELGDEEGMGEVITEGGLRQEWERRRAEERKVKGTGIGRAVRWGRKARVDYVHCRTGKGNLQAWRHVLDEYTPDRCRKCGRYAETGKHVALVCIHGEDIGRRWKTWDQMVEPERWRKRVKDPDEVYELDLVETFFTNLDLN